MVGLRKARVTRGIVVGNMSKSTQSIVLEDSGKIPTFANDDPTKERDERVFYIARMMNLGHWERGIDLTPFADTWGLSTRTVGDMAQDAAKYLRWFVQNPEDVIVDLQMGLHRISRQDAPDRVAAHTTLLKSMGALKNHTTTPVTMDAPELRRKMVAMLANPNNEFREMMREALQKSESKGGGFVDMLTEEKWRKRK